jgi:hypothetical protein
MGNVMGVLKYPVFTPIAPIRKYIQIGSYVIASKRCRKKRMFEGKKMVTDVHRPADNPHTYFLNNEKIGYKSVELELY